MKDVVAIVPAFGSSRRFGDDKLWRELEGIPVIIRSLQLLADAGIERYIAVVPQAKAFMLEEWARSHHVSLTTVEGGQTRQESVRHALDLVPDDVNVVVVHDAARPLCPPQVVVDVVEAARTVGAATAGSDVVDTIARRSGQGDYIEAILDRHELIAVQTPQAFRTSILRLAHADAPGDMAATDDTSLVRRQGGAVAVVRAPRTNMKITERADLTLSEGVVSG